MHYFISDVHLGGGTPSQAKRAEQRFVAWLDSVADSATTIFLNGDIFDFWFEYKRVVPKGFVRPLAKIASLTDRGVRVVFMAGNHDQWLRDYFAKECGMEVYTTPHIFEVEGRMVYLAHGDNLNVRNNVMLKFMNWSFHSSFIRRLFSGFIHPDWTLKFGLWWSRSSRAKHDKRSASDSNNGLDDYLNSLLEHAKSVHASTPCDYYLFGHLHLTHQEQIDKGAKVIFTNDWSETPHMAVIDKAGDITLIEI